MSDTFGFPIFSYHLRVSMIPLKSLQAQLTQMVIVPTVYIVLFQQFKQIYHSFYLFNFNAIYNLTDFVLVRCDVLIIYTQIQEVLNLLLCLWKIES